MAEPAGFSHITVNADDDDDVVIQAGIVEDATGLACEPTDGPKPRPGTSAGPATGPAPTDGASTDPEPADEPDSDPVDGAQPAPAAPEPVRPAADDGYRATTLADVEGSSMSRTQKAVIVVAVLAIVAFVLWYNFAR